MTEDKREKELTTANDCEWIRALDSNGNGIKISKVSLVELIRANMPVATNLDNGLFNRYWTKKVISEDIYLNRDEIYNFETGGYFAALISNSINGNAAIIVFSYFHIHIFGSDSDFSGQDINGKICIFKRDDGTYVLKNRMYDELRLLIDIL